VRLPACAAERGGFMAPFGYARRVRHPATIDIVISRKATSPRAFACGCSFRPDDEEFGATMAHRSKHSKESQVRRDRGTAGTARGRPRCRRYRGVTGWYRDKAGAVFPSEGDREQVHGTTWERIGSSKRAHIPFRARTASAAFPVAQTHLVIASGSSDARAPTASEALAGRARQREDRAAC
jgi:hypothetical protein